MATATRLDIVPGLPTGGLLVPIVSNVSEADVIVVGAGITGLSTAYGLQKAGRKVAVLEAADRVGGRIMTREWKGDRVEVGQQYLLANYENALALVDELGLTGELMLEDARTVQHIDKKGRSHILDGDVDMLRFLGMRGSADIARATLQTTTLGKTFPSYHLDAIDEDHDNKSAADGFAWAGEKFRDFLLRPMSYGTAGTMIDRLSYLDALRLFRLNVQHHKHFGFRRGNVTFPQALAEKVPVLLNAEVVELQLSGDRVSGVKLADGRSIDAGHVILCTVPGVSARLTPSIFARAKEFLSSFHHTRLALAYFHLDRPLQTAAVSFGLAVPEKRYFNMSINHTMTRPFLVPSGKAIVSGWTAFPDAVDMLAASDEEVLSRALEELKLFYPGLSADWVEHSYVVRHDWGYSLQQPGDYKQLKDFGETLSAQNGLSYANADFGLVALESGLITGKRAARHALESARESA